MNKLDIILSEIQTALPIEKIVSDFEKHVFFENEVVVNLEEFKITLVRGVQVDVIAYVIQYGPFGEHSEVRVTLGIGGVEYYSGVGIANICFGTLYYNLNLDLLSVNFYSKIA